MSSHYFKPKPYELKMKLELIYIDHVICMQPVCDDNDKTICIDLLYMSSRNSFSKQTIHYAIMLSV